MEGLCSKAHAVIDAMTPEEWTTFNKQLLLYADSKCRQYRGKLNREPDELVHEALFAVLSGSRLWPPVDKESGMERNVPLVAFLCKVIGSSLCPNICDQEDRIISLDEGAPSPSHESAPHKIYINHPRLVSPAASPYDQVLYSELTGKLHQAVGEDPIATEIIELWIEVPDLKPKEIADILNLPIEQIRSAQKRLRRMCRKLKEVWSVQGGGLS